MNESINLKHSLSRAVTHCKRGVGSEIWYLKTTINMNIRTRLKCVIIHFPKIAKNGMKFG